MVAPPPAPSTPAQAWDPTVKGKWAGPWAPSPRSTPHPGHCWQPAPSEMSLGPAPKPPHSFKLVPNCCICGMKGRHSQHKPVRKFPLWNFLDSTFPNPFNFPWELCTTERDCTKTRAHAPQGVTSQQTDPSAALFPVPPAPKATAPGASCRRLCSLGPREEAASTTQGANFNVRSRAGHRV